MWPRAAGWRPTVCPPCHFSRAALVKAVLQNGTVFCLLPCLLFDKFQAGHLGIQPNILQMLRSA